jgi:hypothetical protein
MMSARESTARGVSKDVSTPLLEIRLQQTPRPIFQPLISSIFLSDDVILFKDTRNTTFRDRGYQPQIKPAAPCLCRLVTTISSLMVLINIYLFMFHFLIIDSVLTDYYVEHQKDLSNVILREFILQGAVQRGHYRVGVG